MTNTLALGVLSTCGLVLFFSGCTHAGENIIKFKTTDCDAYQTLDIPYFRCNSELESSEDVKAECVPASYECDSIIDCSNKRDEMACETEHTENCKVDFKGKVASDSHPLKMFECSDGMCILGCKRCDGVEDCVDSSDEADCPAEYNGRPPCN